MNIPGNRVIAPLVTDDFKYRRIYLAFLKSMEVMMPVIVKHEGMDEGIKVYFKATKTFAKALGKRTVEDYGISADPEGVATLLEVYNRIFSAEKLWSTIDGDVVYHVIEDCTLWEKMFKPLNIKCNESCENSEIPAVIGNLGGEFEVKMPECRPNGDDRCVFKITKKGQ